MDNKVIEWGSTPHERPLPTMSAVASFCAELTNAGVMVHSVHPRKSALHTGYDVLYYRVRQMTEDEIMARDAAQAGLVLPE